MVETISMQDMRYINLFESITKVRPERCFPYNDSLIFIISKKIVSRAIGEDGKNVKRLSEILGKKVKVAPRVNNNGDIEKFISYVIHPTTFNSLEVNENEIVINAGKQNKSSIIGRNKRKFFELKKICEDYLGKELKIV